MTLLQNQTHLKKEIREMDITPDKIKFLLVEPGLVPLTVFNTAVKEATEKKIPLDVYLVENEAIKDSELGQLIANDANVPFVDLKKQKIDVSVMHMVPEAVARSRGVIAYARTDKGIQLGMLNPEDSEIRHVLEKRFGLPVVQHYMTQKDFERALTSYQEGLQTTFSAMLEKLSHDNTPREELDETTIEMVDTLLQYGHQSKASDIHVEPFEKKIVIRFRIDGVMHDVLELPKNVFDLVLTRIKILSKMRTDEHRAAQDGKLRFSTKEETVDVRVSVVPTSHGENIVMRLLSSKARRFALADLGLSGADLERVNAAIKHPHGMILVTGPTGSGKTTTLYGVMKILNKREVNVATIEDPVEYDVEGITQIQVNTKTELTFAKGLRALVRQDPDIIMVGEIRDQETAGIAVNSAMTGHLVLSTLHANDSGTTLPRLLDMGIEPFLVASTVNVVIAQRLVRKVCEKCRVSYTPSQDQQDVIQKDIHLLKLMQDGAKKDPSKLRLYRGGGCKVCSDTGYVGRVGIFEVLEMSEPVKELILKRASSDELMQAGKEQGMTTMFEDGVRKVLAGLTTLEEVFRVTRD
jgi:type IV pilus assembly protein PilB